ncbi:MAG: PQQ-binding-like beta-propeller repeat protein [Planctomycetales bacterium]
MAQIPLPMLWTLRFDRRGLLPLLVVLATLWSAPWILDQSAPAQAAQEPEADVPPQSEPDEGEEDAPADAKKGAKTEAENEAADKQPAAPRNPLTDLIKRSLKTGKKASKLPEIQMPAVPEGKSRKSSGRFAGDQRAPYDSQGAEWLRRATAHADAGEWKEVMELLQRVAEQTEDALDRTEDGRWIPLRVAADRLRLKAPSAILDLYRAQYGGLARQLLREALQGDQLTGLGRVARGYFHTDAGYEAANRLAGRYVDQGNFGLAAYWFAALWECQAPITRELSWRSKAAFAFQQAGQVELGEQLLKSPPVVPGAQVSLGEKRLDPSTWMAQVARISPPAAALLRDWPMQFGNPSRTGVVDGGAPLLLPRWRQPLTTSHPVQTQIEQLVEDLTDAGTIAPSMLYPTMVADKVVFRTLHGVQVVDARSGRLLWETEELSPLESLLSGQPQSDEFSGDELVLRQRVFGRRVRGMWNNQAEFSAGSGEHGALANLLYRNASFGIVSSDGRRLFVVDDPAFLQAGPEVQWDGSPSGMAHPGSRLTAYDLVTGRPLWEVGGVANGEPFDPPLAGYFFFGAPAADGKELYVVAEATSGTHADQIRLLALDPQTGAERWSQRIAYSEPGIDKDFLRRWWSAPVALEAGIAVCPTTAGWIVAVDRTTHALLWGYRLPVPGRANQQRINSGGEADENQSRVQQTQLNGSWHPSPPILAEGKVVYTPLETQTLICLDLYTGKELWSKPRGNNGLYLAGVLGGKILLQGRDALAAYDLATGREAWNLKTPIPSGRGVALADRYLLPLATSEVWSIDLQKGAVAEKLHLPAGVANLGNLAMYQGMLLSLDPLGLTAFEQRDAVQSEIAQRKARDPRDAWALVREAEISAMQRDYPAALHGLRAASLEGAPPDIRERRRTLLIESLRSVIAANFDRPQTDADLRELEGLAQTPAETRQFQRLRTEFLVSRGEFVSAFDALVKLAEEDSEGLVVRDDTPTVQVRSRLWVAGKLRELMDALTPQHRSALQERLDQLSLTAQRGTPAEQERFLELFGDQPATRRVRLALVEHYARTDNLSAAERLLLDLEQDADPSVTAQAIERRARLLLQFDLPADAAREFERLESEWGSTPIVDGQTGATLVQALRASGKFPIAAGATLDWQATGVRVERSGSNYVNTLPQELTNTGSLAPFFRQNRLEIDHASQRLEVSDVATDEMRWAIPLRNHLGSPEGGYAAAKSSGHLLLLLHRGMLHCLSPVDRRILWIRPLENRQGVHVHYNRNINPVQPLQASLSLTGRMTYNQNMGGGHFLSVANDQYVCYPGRRNLTVLDARTGDVRWTLSGVRPGALVFGGRNLLFLRSGDANGSMAFRASDGKRLDLPQLAETLSRAVHAVDDRFVLPVSGGPKAGLRLYDPLTQQDIWKVEFPKGTVMGPLDSERLALLENDSEGGRLQSLDLRTGRLRLLGRLTPDEMKGRTELYAFADGHNVYLQINKGMNQNFYSQEVPFLRAHGALVAFDPVQGKRRWKQTVSQQSLLLERMESSPFLMFASRKFENKGKLQYWSLHLIAIDKLTGLKLLDEQQPSQQGFRSVQVNAADRFVELRGYNDRIRLYPVEKSASAGESGG